MCSSDLFPSHDTLGKYRGLILFPMRVSMVVPVSSPLSRSPAADFCVKLLPLKLNALQPLLVQVTPLCNTSPSSLPATTPDDSPDSARSWYFFSMFLLYPAIAKRGRNLRCERKPDAVPRREYRERLYRLYRFAPLRAYIRLRVNIPA